MKPKVIKRKIKNLKEELPELSKQLLVDLQKKGYSDFEVLSLITNSIGMFLRVLSETYAQIKDKDLAHVLICTSLSLEQILSKLSDVDIDGAHMDDYRIKYGHEL